MKKILNSNSLKIVAIVSMLLDHVAYLFLPVTSTLYFIFRFIGRICAPVMFYSLAKGFHLTKSKFKYGMRLFVFAVVSQIPYSLFMSEKIFMYTEYNVIFTLFLGFLCLLCLDKIKYKLIKYSLVCLFIVLSKFCDYGILGVVLILTFSLFKDKNYKYIIQSLCIFLFLIFDLILYKDIISFVIKLGMFLSLLFIYLDNGEKGKYNLKYLFYVFYPLHLIILFFIKTMIV